MNKIKYLVMDVDGTLTDGKIYMGEEGELFKAFDVKDGYGIATILPNYSITPVIITARESQMVINRANELNITLVFQNCKDKIYMLKELSKGDLSSIAYIGDDISDFQCISEVKKSGGITACPADAIPAIKEICSYVCSRAGGNGAVREFIDWIAAYK